MKKKYVALICILAALLTACRPSNQGGTEDTGGAGVSPNVQTTAPTETQAPPETTIPTEEPTVPTETEPVKVGMDCFLFVYDGTNPTMSKNPDLSDCVVGAFYCMDYQTEEVFLICEDEVSVYNRTNTHVYFVKAAEPTKIYAVPVTDFTAHEVVYQSEIGEINHIYEMPVPFENDVLSVLEGNKRFGVLNLNDGTLTVFTEQYYIANAYIDDDGTEVDSWEDFNVVYFEGKLDEDGELKQYLFYRDTGEIKEDNRL